MIDGKKKWIITPEVFEHLGYKWADIQTVTDTQLKSISDYDDNLIRAIGDFKVYLEVNGVKCRIPNPDIFFDYGFLWSDVKEVDKTTIGKYTRTLIFSRRRARMASTTSTQAASESSSLLIMSLILQRKYEDVQFASEKEMNTHPLSIPIEPSGANASTSRKVTSKSISPA